MVGSDLVVGVDMAVNIETTSLNARESVGAPVVTGTQEYHQLLDKDGGGDE